MGAVAGAWWTDIQRGLSCVTVGRRHCASYGLPTGACGQYVVNPSCHAANSTAVVEKLCVGEAACDVPMDAFGTPCAGAMHLAVQVQCRYLLLRGAGWALPLDDGMV